MRKYLLTCFLFVLAVAAMAQQKTTIHLTKSDHATSTKVNGVDVYKVYQGTFVQKFSVLTSDSAYVYLNENRFDAFGHVVITQGDTLHIYADTLNYNDNTKIAVLTRNVKMVDKDAVLTTNNFTYNTATRVGNYFNGGKLVNKGNTLTSLLGYYYAIPRDSYFRYNVRLVTTDANVLADTLRYNTGSRIAYFLGPTNIYGKKDKDTLYTENGTYNTVVEQAAFGKNNLYKQGTKSLKGDSLFYDRLKGYGRAVKRVTFDDREQKMTIKGDLGEYFKSEDRAVVTVNPYVIFVTEQKDTAKVSADTTKKIAVADTTKKLKTDTLAKKPSTPIKTTALLVGKTVAPAKTPAQQNAASKPAVSPAKTPAKPVTLPPASRTNPPQAKPVVNAPTLLAKRQQILNQLPVKNTAPVAVAAALATATIPQPPKLDAKQMASIVTKPDTTNKLPAVKDTAHIKRDTMYIGADTLETQIITFKALKELKEKRRLAGIIDTGRKLRRPFVPDKVIPKHLELGVPAFIPDTPSYINRPLFVVVKAAVDTTKKKDVATIDTTQKKELLTKENGKKKTSVGPEKKADGKAPPKGKTNAAAKETRRIDPLAPDTVKILPDTARIRVLSAHHNVKIFKSDLQAKSDSLFYSSSDSVIRSYIKPMFWTQGTQLSGDTINLQMKNKKLDNMDIMPNAFAVNIEETDSTTFNQMGGKRMRAYFRDNKMERLNVDGNAETIYFNRDKNKGNKVTSMQRSLSSGIRVRFKSNEVTSIAFIIKADNKDYPIDKVKEDDKVLKNFLWKPKDRPASKQDVIHPKKPVPPAKTPAKGTDGKAAPAKGTADKTPAKTPPPTNDKGKPTAPATNLPAGKDSTVTAPPAAKPQLKKDSTARVDSLKKLPPVKATADTVKKP